MERKEIILIGGIGDSKSFVGGEHSKNMHLLLALHECGRKVVPADLADLKKHPWKGIRALLILILHPRANVIISSSLKRSGWLITLGSPIFPSGCEGKLGVALESPQGLRDLT